MNVDETLLRHSENSIIAGVANQAIENIEWENDRFSNCGKISVGCKRQRSTIRYSY